MSDSENRDGDEVLDLNATGTTTTEEEDRGDVVTPVNATPEAPAEDAGVDSPTGDQRVPIARFNLVNEERKDFQRRWEESQRELERYRTGGAGQPAAAPASAAPAAQGFDEEDMERQYYDAVLNDDRDKAIAIRREINAGLKQGAIEQYRELQAFDSTLAALDQVTQQTLRDYPYLNTPEGDEVLEMIVGLRDRKIQGGMPAHQALSQAVAAIAPRFAPQGSPPGGALPTAQTPVDTRVSRSLARGAADANLQPPAIQAGVGNRTNGARIDVEDLTEDQFSQLTEAERSKLRGD